MWLIIVVMPAIQGEFHIDRADAALPYMLTMIGFAFGNFIIGGFVDLYGIVQVLIAAAVLNAIGLAGAASAPSIAMISGFQFLIGLGNAATFGPLIARFKRWGVGAAKLAVFAADARPSTFNSLRGFIAGRYRYLAAYRLGWRQFISFKIRFDLYEN